MRKDLCALAVLLGLGLASSVWAQRTSLMNGGFRPQQVVNQPIDTSRALAPPPFQPPQASSGFAEFFRKLPHFGLSRNHPLQRPLEPSDPRSPSTIQPVRPITPPARR